MKFGKLSNVDAINFDVNDLVFVNSSVVTSQTEMVKIYLGTTGWSNNEWNGSYYPNKTNTSTFLSEYGKLFNTIELNTTHYHIPSVEKVLQWKSKVNDGFQFCPKVPQDISHRSNLASETSQTKSFFAAMSNLDSHLGPCFMQLPEYFSPTNAEKLLHFLQRKPKHIKFAVELRHEDWFKNDLAQLKIFADQIKTLNTSLVITDVADRRDVCHNILSDQRLILRLVGNSGHRSDGTRMQFWAEQIHKFKDSLSEVFIFFHQPNMDQIPEMVNYFLDLLEKHELNCSISRLKPKYQSNIQLRLF